MKDMMTTWSVLGVQDGGAKTCALDQGLGGDTLATYHSASLHPGAL